MRRQTKLYKKGKDNIAADALSRLHQDIATGQVFEVTSLRIGWLADIVNSYGGDIVAQEIITGITLQQP